MLRSQLEHLLHKVIWIVTTKEHFISSLNLQPISLYYSGLDGHIGMQLSLIEFKCLWVLLVPSQKEFLSLLHTCNSVTLKVLSLILHEAKELSTVFIYLFRHTTKEKKCTKLTR